MEIQKHSEFIFQGVRGIIENARKKVAVFLNAETTLLYWQIGNYINQELIRENRAEYGATIIATLSQQLCWSHLIELSTIEKETENLLKEIIVT